MKREDFKFFIEQPQLNEKCPCGSAESFGACCGGENDCDCKSHLLAFECCYKETDEKPQMKRTGKKA